MRMCCKSFFCVKRIERKHNVHHKFDLGCTLRLYCMWMCVFIFWEWKKNYFVVFVSNKLDHVDRNSVPNLNIYT